MMIDAHVHFPPGGRVEDLDELIKSAERHGIDKVCMSSLGASWEHFPSVSTFTAANREVKFAMDRYPDRVLGFAYVNPTFTQEAIREFKTCIEDFHMSGLKLWVSCRCTEPAVYPLIELAVEYRVPCLIHSWAKATGNLPGESTPQDVAELARRFPEAKIIMAHMGGDWELGIKAVRNLKNVLVDTSGTICESGMIEYAVRILGAERIVYGSDAPGADFSTQIWKVKAADISEEEKLLILGGNMKRILG
ncbi:MAG: amidohydrolase family protein [Candidatus Bathyarchaeia archaeon]